MWPRREELSFQYIQLNRMLITEKQSEMQLQPLAVIYVHLSVRQLKMSNFLPCVLKVVFKNTTGGERVG